MSEHTAPLPAPHDAYPGYPGDYPSGYPDTRSGRHPVNVGHLVMGVALVGLAGVWALVAGDVVEGSDIRWLLPVPWVAAGLAGVLASILPARRHRAAESSRTGWVIPGPTSDQTPDQTPDPTPEEHS